MDFLRIRQKAKERAVERDRTARAALAATPPPAAVRGADGHGAASTHRAPAEAPPPAAVVSEEAPGSDFERLVRGAPAGAPQRDPLDEFFWRDDEVAPCLADLTGAVAVRPAAEVIEVRREWIAFLLGGEEYAVEIGHVREILKAPAITDVPRAPDHVLGVIMVRGEVIAVFDPRRQLGLPAAVPGRAARVLVCDAGDGPRGLLVDAVSGVVRLLPSAIEVRPNGIGGGSGDAIVGIGRDRGRLFILLDVAEVLRATPAAKTEAAP